VAADGEHARAVAGVLLGITGQAPTVVLHTETRAAEKLQEFTRSSERWIVAVNMVSEGVDIPRLRVGVYATAAKTPLVFRQIVGRFVRTIPGRPREPSFVFLPADPVLRAHADEVQRELRHVLVPPGEVDAEAFDERPERRESERGEVEAFVPVAADVAPQLALFGPPGGAATPLAAAPVVDEPHESAMPAFERRALLRDKRHRLVADLRRSQGGSHAEINRWLNRSCGIRRVQDASIDQLERSIDLLLGRLSGRR
jgi:superfamily II DNA or RNA helicase